MRAFHRLSQAPRLTHCSTTSAIPHTQRPNHHSGDIPRDQADLRRTRACERRICRRAGTLGVKKGEAVALVLPNCPQFLIAEIGIWKLGAIVFPLNPLYRERELQTALDDSDVETVVALTRFYAPLCAIQRATRLKRIIATNIKEYLPRHLRVLFTLFRERKEGRRIALRPDDFWFQDLLAAHGGTARPATSPKPDDPAIMLMSGGTTGTPKRVVGHHRSLVAARFAAPRMDETGIARLG